MWAFPKVADAGKLAILRSRSLRGRCVRVLAVDYEWDQQAITASLEHNKRFAEGCWHVNDMFCLTRRFGSTEASCERWIGNLKYLYHPVQGPTTTALCQRLRARAAGIRGNGG